jgi:hypothetical protein
MFRAGSSLRNILRHRTFSAYARLRDDLELVLSRNPGNALFDDLCDILVDFWQGDPARRVIIVAGDTPTVDMLERRLSELFLHLADGGIATMRGRHNTGLVDVVGAIESQATVLIMEEFVEAGLNLHNVASDMIFYNLPWQAVRIDQLIGRLDRLRSGGLAAYLKDRSVGTIGIWRMIVAGSADERVLQALDLLDVFERPLPYLDEALSQRIDSIITEAAAGRAGFKEAAIALKDELSFGLSVTAGKNSPVEQGKQDEITEIIGKVRASDSSGNDWLRLLHRSGGFHGAFLRVNDHEKVVTLALPTLIESCPYNLGAMTTHQPEVFRWRRDRLGRPPRKDIILPWEQVGRRARFFSTGDDLHDDLVRQAYLKARVQPFSPKPIGVYLADGELTSELTGKTLLFVRTASRPSMFLDRNLKAHTSDAPAVRIGRLSDRRWLSTLFPDAVKTTSLVIADDGSVQRATDKIIQAFLSDSCRQTTNQQIQQTIRPIREAKMIVAGLEQKMLQEQRTRHAKQREATLNVFSNRRQILTSETETYVRWKQKNIEQLRSRNIQDKQQIQMTEGQISSEIRRIEARILGMTDRLRTMEDLIMQIPEQITIETVTMFVKVLPSQN